MKKELYLNDTFELYCVDCSKITKFDEFLDKKGGYLQGVVCKKCGTNRQQKNPSYYHCHLYKAKCKCGKEFIALTQEDSSPEYHTDVGVVCDCGQIVWFILPVN